MPVDAEVKESIRVFTEITVGLRTAPLPLLPASLGSPLVFPGK